MKSLEERLMKIKKPELTAVQLLEGKARLQKTKTTHIGHFGPVFVSVAMIAILLFFIFVPTSTLEKNQTATDPAIVKLEAVINFKPSHRLNAGSINYIEKRVLTDEKSLQQLQQLLNSETNTKIPWYGEIENDFLTYDLLVTYVDGTKKSYVFDRNEDSSFIDVSEKMRYRLSYEDDIAMSRLIGDLFVGKGPWSWKHFIPILIGLGIIIVAEYFIMKRFGIKDESGKQKKLPFWISLITYFIFICPIIFQDNIIGSWNIGYMMTSMLLYFIVSYELQKYFKVIRPHPYFYRFTIPIYCLMCISFILIIV